VRQAGEIGLHGERGDAEGECGEQHGAGSSAGERERSSNPQAAPAPIGRACARFPDDADAARKAIATIERNARAQARLIENLLDVSRIVSGNLRLQVIPIDR
jgi:signal transduction histidine kinase